MGSNIIKYWHLTTHSGSPIWRRRGYNGTTKHSRIKLESDTRCRQEKLRRNWKLIKKSPGWRWGVAIDSLTWLLLCSRLAGCSAMQWLALSPLRLLHFAIARLHPLLALLTPPSTLARHQAESLDISKLHRITWASNRVLHHRGFHFKQH